MLIDAILARKGRTVISIRPDKPVSAAVALLAEHRIGAVVVEDRDRIAGIFSERDLVKLLARTGAAGLNEPVRSVMSSPVITCAPGDRIDQVMASMDKHHVRHMPVTEDDRMVGIVSLRDLGRHRLNEKELETATLLDISRRHG
ncbi:CBS domain-containing protein [Rhizosaccharibacter radicis]|uniref:CBS domain-containing protein n=1 Tax=Rhizosaccharibacter radicis TaxID=2782605 RepID=A0ABT1W0X5_9PROT|nr:CBS domain-containing protein [Acetobacteraceae bacterium KSS12]